MTLLGSIMTRPGKGALYLSNLGVWREKCGHGIEGALIETKRREARDAGYRRLAFDVADNYPGALKLYRRLGFEVTGQKVFSGAVSGFPDYHKMELAL